MNKKLLFAIIGIIFSSCQISSQSISKQDLHIFSSCNLMGYVKPCG